MILEFYGWGNLRSVLRSMADVGAQGTSLLELSSLAARFGFDANGYQINYDLLPKLTLPCIAHFEGDHFVVVYRADGKHVWVANPGSRKARLTREEFVSKWDGVVLSLRPDGGTTRRADLMNLIAAQRAQKRAILNSFFAALWENSRPAVPRLLVASACLQISWLVLPLMLKLITDGELGTRGEGLGRTLLLAGGGLLAYGVSAHARNASLSELKLRAEAAYSEFTLKALVRLRSASFGNFNKDDLANVIRQHFKIRRFFAPNIFQPFAGLLLAPLYCAALFLFAPVLAVAATATVGLLLAAAVYASLHLHALEKQAVQESHRPLGSLRETLSGIGTVKRLALEHWRLQDWRDQHQAAQAKLTTTDRRHARRHTALKLAAFLCQAAVYILGAYLTARGALSPGRFVAFILIFSSMMLSLQGALSLSFVALDLVEWAERLTNVLTQEREDRLPAGLEVAGAGGPDIELQEVSWAPRASGPDVLKRVNLTVRAGEHLTIRGEGGSGKTALAGLLTKMHSNYRGRILVGGQDLREIDPHHLREKIIALGPDECLFSGTLRANVACGLRVSDAALTRAAELAGLTDVLESRGLSFAHQVTEDDPRLSGGHRARIAFARLFLRQPSVIVLDDAFKDLDFESELKITANLKEHFKGRVIIQLVRQPRNTEGAGRVLSLNGGSIRKEEHIP